MKRRLKLEMELSKKDQELLLLKQKHQGDKYQYDNQKKLLEGQVEQSKKAIQQLQHK